MVPHSISCAYIRRTCLANYTIARISTRTYRGQDMKCMILLGYVVSNLCALASSRLCVYILKFNANTQRELSLLSCLSRVSTHHTDTFAKKAYFVAVRSIPASCVNLVKSRGFSPQLNTYHKINTEILWSPFMVLSIFANLTISIHCPVKTPFVLGMSDRSIVADLKSAIPNALKIASTMWWSFTPYAEM